MIERYSALEKGSQDLEELAKKFIDQVPKEGVQVFPLDTTIWAHPRARTLSDLIYGRSPTKALKSHSIVQGHEHSLLTWTPEPGQSWSLPISSQRLVASDNAIAVGVAQVEALCQARQGLTDKGLDVIVVSFRFGPGLTIAGPLNPLSAFANKSSTGPYLVSRPATNVIAGPIWLRWLVGRFFWPATSFKISPSPGRNLKLV